MRSRELQTKEKQKVTKKGKAVKTVGGQGVAEPMGDRQEATGGSAGKKETEAGEMVEADVPLVRKRKRLMKAEETASTKENVAVKETGPVRYVTERVGREPRGREGSVMLGATQSGDSGEEGQAALPLVLVPLIPFRRRNQQPEGSRKPRRGGCKR